MSVVLEKRPVTLNLPSIRRQGMADLGAVALPTMLALALCLYDLTTRSLWLDESATIAIASQHGAAFASALAHDGGNMAGYYALVHLLIGAFGNGAVVVRLPSALAAAATVGLLSALGLRLFNRRVGLVAGLLCAVSLPLVYWGQDARGYTLMVALVCASFLVLVLAVQRPQAGWPLWLAYVAVTTAALYVGLVALFILPAQLVILAWHRRRTAWLLTGMLATLVCSIPLAVLALERGATQVFWIPAPSAFTTKQVLLTLTSGGLEPQFYSPSGDVLRYLTELLVAGAGVWCLTELLSRRTRTAAWRPVLALSWTLVPLVLIWTVSKLGQSMYEARYLLISLPAVALTLAWLLTRLAEIDLSGMALRRGRPYLRSVPVVGAVVLALALLVVRGIQVGDAYGVSTEPWRTVSNVVLTASRPGDCIAFYPMDGRMPFRYYLPAGASAPRPVLPNLPWPQVRSFVEDYATLSPAQVQRVATS
ncbi:MAG TPA: glycosyltransferase family 39 protein, partial [Solirubrobacteraceae bacterium]|nr:glycosyltransferase family 39 protein [Solirubrobacteraceae bacterium]